MRGSARGDRAAVPTPPFLVEALVPAPDGTSVAVRAGGRTLGRVDPAVPAALGLRAGSLVEENCWPALQAAMARRAAFDAGVRLLARRPHSRASLERRLVAGFGETAAADALTRLSPYLDDRAFSQIWVEARLGRGPVGRIALLAGLRKEGVAAATAREAVDAALPEAGVADLVRRAAERRLAQMRGVPAQRLRPRLFGYLSRRGFPAGAIAAALRAVLDSDADADGPQEP